MNSLPISVKADRIVILQAFSCRVEPAEWKLSDIPEDGILIRTAYSLISPGTELAFYAGTHIDLHNPANKWAKLPFYPGYASTGEVVAFGSAVNRFRAGDKVLALGRHAGYDVVHDSDEYIVRLPEGVDPKHALFARLAEISSSALIQSRFGAGSSVVVIGMGLIGNLAAQLYTLQGAHVIGVDVDTRRLAAANAAQVASTVLSGEGVDIGEAVKRFTGGKAPDIVVEATGSPALANTALELVRRHGQVILLGSPRGTAEINIYKHIHSKGVSLIGAHDNVKGIDGLPTSAELLAHALRLLANGALRVDPLITHVLPAKEAAGAYEMLLHHKDDALGVILDWTGRD